MIEEPNVAQPVEAEAQAYRDWEPGERISSPSSSRHTFKVRNQSGESGKYSLKIGTLPNEHFRISNGATEQHDVGGNAVIGTNDGGAVLQWNRT